MSIDHKTPPALAEPGPGLLRGKRAEIAVDQIRTVSKERLIRRLDKLTSKSATELRRVISEMYGDG